MVTKDEFSAVMDDVLGGVKGNVADIQSRVRGVDTGDGQEHQNYDMLQGIDATVNRIEGVVNNLWVAVRGGYSGADKDQNNVAGIWWKAQDLQTKVDALTTAVAELTKLVEPPAPPAV